MSSFPFDSSQLAEFLEASVRPIESLSGLHTLVEQPTPGRLLFHVSIRRLLVPTDVAPEDRFVGRRRFPNGSSVETIVEEENESTTPIASDRMPP
jgi:hypothetical protein